MPSIKDVVRTTVKKIVKEFVENNSAKQIFIFKSKNM